MRTINANDLAFCEFFTFRILEFLYNSNQEISMEGSGCSQKENICDQFSESKPHEHEVLNPPTCHLAERGVICALQLSMTSDSV